MSAPAQEGFSVRAILVLVAVSIVAFCGFVVLGVYAPELRSRSNLGANAMSGSAVGYRGAVVLWRSLEGRAEVNRGRFNARALERKLLVQTPEAQTTVKALNDHPDVTRTLIVLPKWQTARDPIRPGIVRKAGAVPPGDWAAAMLKRDSGETVVQQDKGRHRTALRGQAWPFKPGDVLPLGPIDKLQTVSGPGWAPVLVDPAGRGVLVHSKTHPYVYLLADPDLLNNQGLADLDNARAGMAILRGLQGPSGVVFDVTLNGLKSERSLGRLALEPPWLAATLCLVAAALLMGVHGLARFGAPRREARAIALGASALVENSAGLIRMARKAPALAPDYLQGLLAEVARAGGSGRAVDPEALARQAARLGLASPDELAAEAAEARTPDELMAFASKAYHWRREMVRDGR